jgi:hypothetical protein
MEFWVMFRIKMILVIEVGFEMRIFMSKESWVWVLVGGRTVGSDPWKKDDTSQSTIMYVVHVVL